MSWKPEAGYAYRRVRGEWVDVMLDHRDVEKARFVGFREIYGNRMGVFLIGRATVAQLPQNLHRVDGSAPRGVGRRPRRRHVGRSTARAKAQAAIKRIEKQIKRLEDGGTDYRDHRAEISRVQSAIERLYKLARQQESDGDYAWVNDEASRLHRERVRASEIGEQNRSKTLARLASEARQRELEERRSRDDYTRSWRNVGRGSRCRVASHGRARSRRSPGTYRGRMRRVGSSTDVDAKARAIVDRVLYQPTDRLTEPALIAKDFGIPRDLAREIYYDGVTCYRPGSPGQKPVSGFLKKVRNRLAKL